MLSRPLSRARQLRLIARHEALNCRDQVGPKAKWQVLAIFLACSRINLGRKPTHEGNERLRLWPRDLTVRNDREHALRSRFIIPEHGNKAARPDVLMHMEAVEFAN